MLELVCKKRSGKLKITIYQLGSCQSIKKALSIFLKVLNFLEHPTGTTDVRIRSRLMLLMFASLTK